MKKLTIALLVSTALLAGCGPTLYELREACASWYGNHPYGTAKQMESCFRYEDRMRRINMMQHYLSH
mgnify:CR=1 FL=1